MIDLVLIVLSHAFLVGVGWSIGHFIYLVGHGCIDHNVGVSTCYFTNFASQDFLGFICALIASGIYVYIGKYVVKAIYGGTLPDGSHVDNITRIMEGFMTGVRQPKINQKKKLRKL